MSFISWRDKKGVDLRSGGFALDFTGVDMHLLELAANRISIWLGEQPCEATHYSRCIEREASFVRL